MDQVFLLIFNAILYSFYFLVIVRSNLKGKIYALIILSLFLISSLCSVLYYETPIYFSLTERGENKLSIWALLFIFFNLVIFIRPLLSYKLNDRIVVPNNKTLYYLSVFLGIVSIVPFIESSVYLLNYNAIKISAVYYDKMEENYDYRSHLSSFGKICTGFVVWFQYVTPSLFFYTLSRKKSLLLTILSLLAFLNPVLLGIIVGGRGELFQVIFILVLNYFLFRQYFSKSQDKLIKTSGLILCTIVILGLFFITYSRATNNSSVAHLEIYRYLGEGFVNFSEKGWYVSSHTNGYSIINGTGHTFLRYISDYFDSRDFSRLGQTTGMRMYVYYTVFGDYYIDFGFLGGILFNTSLAFMFYMLVKGKETHFSSILLVNLYAKIGINGIYYYMYMYRIEFLLFTFLIIFILRKFEKVKKKRVSINN